MGTHFLRRIERLVVKMLQVHSCGQSGGIHPRLTASARRQNLVPPPSATTAVCTSAVQHRHLPPSPRGSGCPTRSVEIPTILRVVNRACLKEFPNYRSVRFLFLRLGLLQSFAVLYDFGVSENAMIWSWRYRVRDGYRVADEKCTEKIDILHKCGWVLTTSTCVLRKRVEGRSVSREVT